MKPSSLFGLAGELLEILLHDQRPADHIIDIFFRQRRYLGSHDRRALAESVYGILRHRRLLQTLVARVEAEKTFSPAWLLAAYQLHFEKQTPAVVNEAAPIPLEQLQQLAAQALSAAEQEDAGIRLSFPDWFAAAIAQQWHEQSAALLEALNQTPPLTLRVNTLKTTRESCLQELQQRGFACTPTTLSPTGIQLEKRANLFGLDLFREGWFEVQDEGSQLISLLLDPKPNWRVADVCAGGGGKSLHLASLMKNRGELFAFDVIAARLENLKKRARRSGAHNIRTQVLAANALPQNLVAQLDAVLIDAPCSGSGVLRRNPDAKWKISAEMVHELAQKQREIILHYAQLVKPGGRLVYATCSLMTEENEAVVDFFRREREDFREGAAATILQRYDLAPLAVGNCIKLTPQQHGCDGFFAAVFERMP